MANLGHTQMEKRAGGTEAVQKLTCETYVGHHSYGWSSISPEVAMEKTTQRQTEKCCCLPSRYLPRPKDSSIDGRRHI